MPTESHRVREYVEASVHEMSWHCSTIEWRLQLGAPTVTLAPPKWSILSGIEIRDFTGDQTVTPHEIIVPLPKAAFKHEAAFRPYRFIGRCSQKIADRPYPIFLTSFDDFELTNKCWALIVPLKPHLVRAPP